MRLINADELITELENYNNNYNGLSDISPIIDDCINIINETPNEIIYCKDCRFKNKEFKSYCNLHLSYGWDDNCFCNKGELDF